MTKTRPGAMSKTRPGAMSKTRQSAPKLTPAQETELLRQWREDQNYAARNQIIEAYLPALAKVADRKAKIAEQRDDLRQQCVFAMISAIDRFDPAMGASLYTYMQLWAKDAISKYIARLRTDLTVPISPASRRLFAHYHQFDQIIAKHRRHETGTGNEIIGRALGATPDMVAAVKMALTPSASLDYQVFSDEGLSVKLSDMIEDDAQISAFDLCAEMEQSRKLTEFINQALQGEPARDAQMFRAHFAEGKKFQAIGIEHHISTQRAQQICKRLMIKMQRRTGRYL
jgi:RNA polymerase sigma factor (sigma-70 family)